MTVSELIKALKQQPEDARVEVAGFSVANDADMTYEPHQVETMKSGEGEVFVVIWAEETQPK